MSDNLKKTLAGYFFTDSYEFLNIYAILYNENQSESPGGLPWRSKLFVNLLLSMECSLKTLIFLRTADSEDEKAVYKNIRKSGHSLESLLSKVDLTGLETIADFIRKNKIDKIPIDVRYALEAGRKLYDDNMLSTDDYYNIVSNPLFVEEVESCAKKLLDFVSTEYDVRFSPFEVNYIEDLNFGELEDNESRIKHISDRP